MKKWNEPSIETLQLSETSCENNSWWNPGWGSWKPGGDYWNPGWGNHSSDDKVHEVPAS